MSTALAARNAEATYRSVDLAGRTGSADNHQLVALLYDELVRALNIAALAAEKKNFSLRADRVTRATAILFALEAGLDFERGGDVSRTLAQLYRGLRAQVLDASIGTDPAPFRAVAKDIAEIAGAWNSVRAS